MMQKTSWPPDFRLPDYSGPYPRRELEASRKELIATLTAPPFSMILEQVKPLIGISSSFGNARPPPPLPKKFYVQEHKAGSSWLNTSVGGQNIAGGGGHMSMAAQNVSMGGHNISMEKQNIGTQNMSMGEQSMSIGEQSNMSVGKQNISMGEQNISMGRQNSLNTSRSPGQLAKQHRSGPMVPAYDKASSLSCGPSPGMHSFAAPLMASPFLQSTPISKQRMASYEANSFQNLKDSGCFADTSARSEASYVGSDPSRNMSGVNDNSNSGVTPLLSLDAIPSFASRDPSPSPELSHLKRRLDIADYHSTGAKRPRYDSAGEQYASSSPDSPNSELLYKCDFCQYTSKDPYHMETHLTNAKHFSGSLYNAISNSVSGNKLISIEQMLALKNPYSMTKALIVACPDCREIFEDIFMCSMHHKFVHGSVHGCYAICPIIHHETVTFSLEPQCSECGTLFQRHKDLHKHWNEAPLHHPLKQPTKSNIFVIYICPYCSKIFYNNFLACKTHVLGHNRTSVRYALEIKHVLQPLKKHELPPFNTANGRRDGLEHELAILKNMRSFYMNDISGAKAKAHRLSDRISTLKSILNKT